MKSEFSDLLNLLKLWRDHVEEKLKEWDRSHMPGTADVIEEYRVRIWQLKRVLRLQGVKVEDAPNDGDPIDYADDVQRGLLGEIFPPSAVEPADKFLSNFAEHLQRERGFVHFTQSDIPQAYIGIREGELEVQSVALVVVDGLSKTELANLDEAYFAFLRSWRPRNWLLRMAKKNGLLMGISSYSPPVLEMESIQRLLDQQVLTMKRKSRDSNSIIDAALSAPWLLDLNRRDVFTPGNLVSTFPPVFTLPNPKPDYVRGYMHTIDRMRQEPAGAQHSRSRPTRGSLLSAKYVQQLLAYRRSVVSIRVPQFANGVPTGHVSVGTAWQIAPGYIMTCWHVVAARMGPAVNHLSEADRVEQLAHAVVALNYTKGGQSVRYKVAGCVHHDSRLDFAILELQDSETDTLSQWGALAFSRSAPIDRDATLYIIQHPFGKAQQYSFGRILTMTQDSMEHNVPAAGGTSGAPIISADSGNVIAMHRSRNMNRELMETDSGRYWATLMPTIYENIPEDVKRLLELL